MKSQVQNSQVRRIWLLIAFILSCYKISAYDFQADGFYFDIIKGTNEVYIHPAHAALQIKYSGDIIVPETVKDYNGNVYTVVGIGEYAFSGSSISSIKLPNTIRFIDQYAFWNCSQLKNLELPNSLISIGERFISGSAIMEIKIPSSVTQLASYAFCESSLETIDLTDLSSSITKLPEGVFRSCKLKSIIIPNSIATIGKSAFDGCDFLKSVVLPNSLTTIEAQAFYNCSSLEDINLPNQISSIGNFAFWGCSSLKAINIPSSLSKIEDYVFHGCQSLVSIQFPDKITEIGKSSFGGCKDLKEIDFSNSLTKIGETAFEGCSSLTNILLPASLTSIGKKAFYSCSALKTVESKIKEPFETYAFTTWSGSPDDRILYVPSGTKEKYINCYGWGNFFKDVIEKVETYTLSITASGNGSASYNGTTLRGKTSSFTVNAGTSATITFSPDNGYRIKSVKVNNSTVSVSNNQYTINSINANTTISVEFEAIPVTTYTLSITASGNGSAFYGGTTVRGKTSSFTLNAGTSATISFTPDNGYRIKSVKVNNSTVTVSNNQYTISNINANTTVSVEFEAITYTLSITASGNGSASYSGTTVRGKTSSFTLNAGSSATITFSPDNGYRIKSVKVNNTTVSVSNNQYIISSINANTTVSVEFEAIPVTTYTLSITASGNGSASYSGTTIRSKTSTFTVNAGSSATITFTPDNGYRIKSVKVNNTTVSVSNNQYTISSINANTSVSVEFEAIPVTTYTLSITASGNGSASYSGSSIRSKTSSFTVNAGTSATITFSPDNGYRIKSVKVNNTTVSVSNNQYTISSINANTSVSVEFEAIPVTTYTLSITASGNGSASYSGSSIRSKTSSFTVNAGTSATITFSPDNGYRIKSVKVNNSTVSVSNNQYTISSINANTTVSVEFEAIPPTTYTLSITASGNGSASYSGTTIRSKTSSFTLNAGSSATITFSPDNGYRIKSVKVNNSTVSVPNNQYTISSINANTTVSVEFEAIPATTYTLSITASGNGSASYSGTTIRSKTSSFTLNAGSSATITFSPDNGYRIKSVKVNNTTVSVSNNQYTISSINSNTTVSVEFEAVPVTTYTLTITARGNGTAVYGRETIRFNTSTFSLSPGTSATISFTPDDGYRIKYVKVNGSTVSVSNNQYTVSNINQDTTVEVSFEEIPTTTYTLSITVSGNGSASYSGTTIRSKTSTFTVSAGSSAMITFSPDNGYRIKSVKVNNSTVSVSNNQYTVSSINANTTVSVEFEAIPVTTYTLSITASGNGLASYSGTTIRSKTSTFTVNAGSSATIAFTPDNGYRIMNVKVNNTTVSVSNNQYTISSINANTTVSVEFEAIPATTYTLSITASGNGSASYSGTTIRSKTSSFTLNAGSSATITFSPDNGYQIKNVKVNNSTVSVSNNQYTISSINANTTVSVEFEAIPVTYTLSITATGNGSASYDGTTIRGKTSSFTVNEGTTVKISITPDNGYRIKSVKENNTVVTSYVSNGIYTINSLSRNTTVEVEFVEILQAFSVDDVNYTVVSVDEQTIRLAKGDYGITLEVPAKVNYQNTEWTVTGIDNGALSYNPDLAAIVWNPDVAFTEQVGNPNLLLYVNQTQYAPSSIKNVVVNGNATSITLTDAASGNNFHCPQTFTAQKISYTHNYSMETGIGEAKGWETIALPFDVQKVTHESKGEIVSFANWRSGDSKRPFWLMQLSGNGWTMATSIKANTPYIISMPKNDEYKVGFWLNGRVTFSAENVNVPKTENLTIARYNDETFVPTFVSVEKSNDVLALNVVNDIERVTGSSTEGSTFVKNLRPVHPFEAYKTSTSSTRSIAIDEGMATGIIELITALSDEGNLRIYNLNGQLIKIEEGMSLDEVMRELPAGVYIVNGKKMIIR